MERQSTLRLEAFGARISVRAPASLEPQKSLPLPPRARMISGKDFDTTYSVETKSVGSDPWNATYEVLRDGVVVGRCATADAVRLVLESDMHFRVALAARGFLFVHAGVVEHMGRAIVIPGRTRAGKSSLVMALVRAGATYFSDEYAVVDRYGLIHPYRKPLSERVADQVFPRLHTPESIGAAGEASPRPVGLTLITRYRPRARWDPRSGSKAEALIALFDNTVVARSRPAFALDLLSRAVQSTAVLKGDRPDAKRTAVRILSAVGSPPIKPQ